DFVKLEVIGDEETLLPDVAGLLEATKVLVQEGFKVLAYTNEDLVTALRLEDAGCAAVMPLASPIGSGLGLLNPFSVRTITRRPHAPPRSRDAVVADEGDAGLRQQLPRAARRSIFSARSGRERCCPTRATVTSQDSPSVTAVSPTSCRPAYCAASESSTRTSI